MISGTPAFCPGGSTTLTGPNGYSYSWSNGQTTQSINVSSAALYTLTIADNHGCTATSSVNVTIDPGTSQTFILRGTILNPKVANTNSTLQVSLQNFDSIGLSEEPGTGSAWPTGQRVIGGPLR